MNKEFKQPYKLLWILDCIQYYSNVLNHSGS